MAELRIDIILNDNGAVQRLQQVEDATKRVEQASERSATSVIASTTQTVTVQEQAVVSAVKAASARETLSRASAAAAKTEDALVKSTQTLNTSTAEQLYQQTRAALGMQEMENRLSELDTATASLTASTALSGLEFVAIGGYLGAAIAAGGLWARFLYDSAEAYLEHTGKIDEFKNALSTVTETWQNMKIAVGAVLLGNVDDLTSWASIGVSAINMFAEAVLSKLSSAIAMMNIMADNARKVWRSLPFTWMLTPENTPPPAPDIGQNGSAVGPLNTRGFFRENEIPSAFTFDSPTTPKRGTGTGTSNAAATARADADSLRESVQSLRADIQAVNYYVTNIPLFQRLAPVPPLPNLPTAVTGVPDWLPGGVSPAQLQGLMTPPAAPAGQSFLSSIFGGSSGFGAGIAQSIMGAIQGGGNVLEAGGSFIGSKLGSGLGKLLSTALPGVLGSAFNAVLPGVGAMLGPLLGKIGGYFKNLFGGGSAGRDTVKSFAASMGGFDALHKQLNDLGSLGEKLWINLTQGVGRNNPAEAKRAIGAISDALAALPQYKSLMDQIAEAGRTDWQKLDEAAKRYGIDIATLGGTFQAQRLHDGWQQIIDDMDLFSRGGADMGQILAGMGPKISELVQQSIAFGTVIPENMRPWIQQLMDSHQLLDASGKEITDISTMTFGETMQTTLANLNQTLKDLIATLGGVPGAAQTAVGGWNSAWSGAAKPPYVSDGGSPQDSAPQQEAPPYHSGGLLRIAHRGGLGPDEFPIIAQSGEYMMRRSAVQQYGRSFMSAVNTGSYTPRGGGGGTAIIQLNGRTIGEIVVPHIPGIVKRFRVGTR